MAVKRDAADRFRFHAHHECRVLTESALQHLPDLPRGRLRHVPAGALIYAAGDPTGDVYFLRRGRVSLVAVASDGQERTLLTILPGEIFGELCYCDVRARQDQAVAAEDSDVVALDIDALLDALLADHDAAAALLGTLCARLADAQTQVAEMAFYTVAQRIARRLLALGALGADGDTVTVVPGPTHEEIARSISASRELVTATLAGWRRAGLVRYARGQGFEIRAGALRLAVGLREELHRPA